MMGALTYYSVPLYRLFCQVTGFGGTTQVARGAPGTVEGPPIAVRFDANVAPRLPWRFDPPAPVEPRKPIVPSESEIAANPRSRSAKLRIFQVAHAS